MPRASSTARYLLLGDDAPQDNTQPEEQLSVLIVDEDAEAGRIVGGLVASDPAYRISYVESVRDALEFMEEQRVDVVLVDQDARDDRGLECAPLLHRASPRSALIVLSRVDSEAIGLQAVQQGAHDYLAKDGLDVVTLERSIRYATERQRMEDRLVRLAHFDTLTGLVNRLTFEERLRLTIARAIRRRTACAILRVDVDQFRVINRAFGRVAGDAVMVEIGTRLSACVREYDTVARIEEDEFGILLEDLSDWGRLDDVARRVNERVSAPLPVNDAILSVSAGVGVASFPGSAQSSVDLLRVAHEALSHAKEKGTGQVVVARRVR